MTESFRQHRASIVFRMPWHIEDPTSSGARMLGLLLAVVPTDYKWFRKQVDAAFPKPRGPADA